MKKSGLIIISFFIFVFWVFGEFRNIEARGLVESDGIQFFDRGMHCAEQNVSRVKDILESTDGYLAFVSKTYFGDNEGKCIKYGCKESLVRVISTRFDISVIDAELLLLRTLADASLPHKVSVTREHLSGLNADLVTCSKPEALEQLTSSLCSDVNIFPRVADVNAGGPSVGRRLREVFRPMGKNKKTLKEIDEDGDLLKKLNPDPDNEFNLSDKQFHKQWYLGGKRQGQPSGANVLDALQAIAGDRKLSEMTSSDFNIPRQNIVVVDMGCGANDDLVLDASLPECEEQKFEPTEEVEKVKGHPLDVIEKIVGSRVYNMISGKSQKATTKCAHSISHMPNESGSEEGYHHDASHHGTTTNSIIGAGWNDKIGITGVCPFCSVKCIKISSGEPGALRVSMNGIFRSLNWLAKNNQHYPISNHSYGGFTLDEAEVKAHEKLNKAGHIVVTSAGNYSCELDEMAKAYGAFDAGGIDTKKDKNQEPLKTVISRSECQHPGRDTTITEPMMPTSVSYKTKVDVGSIGMDGEFSAFSNWGPLTVDIAAPGELILGLKSSVDLTQEENDDPDKQVTVQRGTSFSAPIVSAGLGIIRGVMEARCWAPTGKDVVATLLNHTTRDENLDDRVGKGRYLDVALVVSKIADRCEAEWVPVAIDGAV